MRPGWGANNFQLIVSASELSEQRTRTLEYAPFRGQFRRWRTVRNKHRQSHNRTTRENGAKSLFLLFAHLWLTAPTQIKNGKEFGARRGKGSQLRFASEIDRPHVACKSS